MNMMGSDEALNDMMATEAAMRSVSPVSVARARPEWKDWIGTKVVRVMWWILWHRAVDFVNQNDHLNMVRYILFLSRVTGAKIFQSGITVASPFNPQDPPSMNLGLLGRTLSLGGWAVPSWACWFCWYMVDWNKIQLNCESWILMKYRSWTSWNVLRTAKNAVWLRRSNDWSPDG